MTRPGLPRPDAVLLRLRLIGRMEALTLGNESVLPLGRKTRGLLAILALNGRRPVLRLRLAELLWSRRSEEQARASLRQEIHRLGEALSPLGTEVIAVDRHTMALKPALTSVDAERILTARPGQADALPPIEGVLLEELNGTDPALDVWLAGERSRLRDHAMELFEEMLGRHRDPDGILAAARQLLALDAQHARAWLATLRAHRTLGNLALARQLGERCIAAMEPNGIQAAEPELRDALLALGLDCEPGAAPASLQLDRAGEEQPTATGPAGMTGIASPGPVPDEAPANAPPAFPPAAPQAVAPETLPPTPADSGERPPMVIVPAMVLDAGADAGIGGFATGLAQTLQAALVGNSWCRVLSGSALEECLSHGRDDAVLRRRFGARYLVDGTVQRMGDEVRVILRMSDIQGSGQLLWAHRFDGRADALLALQDRIAEQVSARLPTEVVLAEAAQSRRVPETGLEPHRMAALALHRLNGDDRAGIEATAAMLERGLQRRPDSAHLHVALGAAHLLLALQRWGDVAAHADRAESAARAAIANDPNETLALVGCAFVLSELRDRPEAALALVERALELDACSSVAWAVGACSHMRLGRLDEAERCLRRYKLLFDTHPFAAMLDPPRIMLLLLRGDAEAAARIGLQQTELHPGFLPALVPYLSALGHLRRTAEAGRILERLLQSWPDTDAAVLVARAGLRDPAHEAVLREGLLQAGLPPHGTPAPVPVPAPTAHAAAGAARALRPDPAPGPARPADGATAPAPARARRTRRPLGAEPLAG